MHANLSFNSGRRLQHKKIDIVRHTIRDITPVRLYSRHNQQYSYHLRPSIHITSLMHSYFQQLISYCNN